MIIMHTFWNKHKARLQFKAESEKFPSTHITKLNCTSNIQTAFSNTIPHLLLVKQTDSSAPKLTPLVKPMLLCWNAPH